MENNGFNEHAVGAIQFSLPIMRIFHPFHCTNRDGDYYTTPEQDRINELNLRIISYGHTHEVLSRFGKMIETAQSVEEIRQKLLSIQTALKEDIDLTRVNFADAVNKKIEENTQKMLSLKTTLKKLKKTALKEFDLTDLDLEVLVDKDIEERKQKIIQEMGSAQRVSEEFDLTDVDRIVAVNKKYEKKRQEIPSVQRLLEDAVKENEKKNKYCGIS